MTHTYCMTSNCALAEQCARYEDDAGKHLLTRTYADFSEELIRRQDERHCHWHAAQHLPASRLGMEAIMLYPVYVHMGDKHHAHGVTVPDFPGCYSAADNWDELPAKIQEAIEVYCEGEDMDIPAPTPLETLAAKREYKGGVWMLVDVDVSQLSTRSVRLNVSLPEGLVKRIDAYAKAHHLSRSGFLAKAALSEMERQ